MKKSDKMKTPDEVKDYVFKVLKREGRKDDIQAFMADMDRCHSFVVLKEVAMWYVSKPKGGK